MGKQENKYLYHGSIHSGIETLKPISKLHNSDERVVYLSGSAPYSLFYIWDAKHNKRTGQYVTAWIKDGMTFYEEQFPDQMRLFYDGVKGYLYSIRREECMESVANHEMMYACKSEVLIESVEVIENVYDVLLKYEAEGKLKVIRFAEADKDRIADLYDYIAKRLVEQKIIDQPECEEAVFYKTYFGTVWEMAEEYRNNK